MLQKLQKRNESGFTIVEVLIVLAIAALILLIVFLAVPALQRNARNTGRKEDAGRLASATANFVSNNQGQPPSTAANLASIFSDAGTLNQYNDISGNETGTVPTGTGATAVPLGFYIANPGEAFDGSDTTSADVVIIDVGYLCKSGAKPGAVTTNGATGTDAAVIFSLETTSGSNWNWSCVDST